MDRYLVITINGTYNLFDDCSFTNACLKAIDKYGDELMGIIKVDED